MNTKTDFRAGQRVFDEWLRNAGLRLRHTAELGLQTDDTGWEHFAWTLTVANGPATDPSSVGFEFPFKQGTAHTKKPTLVDIMAALLSDASCVAGNSFTEFCDELGYDRDSRKAEETYKQIQVSNGRLLKLFRVSSLGSLVDKAQPLLEAAGL